LAGLLSVDGAWILDSVFRSIIGEFVRSNDEFIQDI